MANHEYVDKIVKLAQEVESEDPIDWGMLPMDEESAYRLIASDFIDAFLNKYGKMDEQDIMVATVVKLIVENFVLNLKLREKRDGGS